MNQKSQCIFCNSRNEDESVEHIVPRTLGNLHYVLSKGIVCAKCNNKFGLIENRVLSSKIFLDERKRLGLLKENHPNEEVQLKDSDLVRFLLKMAYESLYKSKRKIWERTDFSEPIAHLMCGKENTLFYEKQSLKHLHFRSIPGWIDRWRLSNNHIELHFATSGDGLYFRFQFGRLVSAIKIT